MYVCIVYTLLTFQIWQRILYFFCSSFCVFTSHEELIRSKKMIGSSQTTTTTTTTLSNHHHHQQPNNKWFEYKLLLVSCICYWSYSVNLFIISSKFAINPRIAKANSHFNHASVPHCNCLKCDRWKWFV